MNQVQAKPALRRVGTISAVGALILTAGCSGGGAGGDADTWTLRSNDFNPAAHPFNANGWDFFAEEIESRTAGRVKIEHYPSEGLGAVSDTLTMLSSRTADLASTAVAYHPEDLPLSQATGAAGWDTAALGAQAMWELCNTEPFVSEFKKAEVVPFSCTATPSYELLLSNGEINGIPEAFEGKRIRATGFQQDIVAALGASTTTDPASELYVRMEQNQIDGLTAGWYTLPALSLDEVTVTGTAGIKSWNAGAVVYAMPQSLWDEFPEDIQQAFVEVGREMSLSVGEGLDVMDDEAIAAAEGTVEIYEVSDEEREEVRAVVDETLDTWITKADGAGVEGAQEAAEAVRGAADVQPLDVTEWADFAYFD